MRFVRSVNRFVFLTISLTLFCNIASCSRSEISEIPEKCYTAVDGRKMFIGDTTCMEFLPSKRIDGYLAHGFESSEFYFRIEDMKGSINKNGIWIDLNKEDSSYVGVRDQSDENIYFYKISFIGKFSDRDGYYGHMGMYKSGVLVKKLISLEEISKISDTKRD